MMADGGNGNDLTLRTTDGKLFQHSICIIIIIIAGIAVNETHLTATGIHMSMGSHGITRHPTEATFPP